MAVVGRVEPARGSMCVITDIAHLLRVHLFVMGKTVDLMAAAEAAGPVLLVLIVAPPVCAWTAVYRRAQGNNAAMMVAVVAAVIAPGEWAVRNNSNVQEHALQIVYSSINSVVMMVVVVHAERVVLDLSVTRSSNAMHARTPVMENSVARMDVVVFAVTAVLGRRARSLVSVSSMGVHPIAPANSVVKMVVVDNVAYAPLEASVARGFASEVQPRRRIPQMEQSSVHQDKFFNMENASTPVLVRFQLPRIQAVPIRVGRREVAGASP